MTKTEATQLAKLSTADLIAEYDRRMAARFERCQLGSTRFAARQREIDAIVDELSHRADADDAVALTWFEEA